MSGEKGQTPRGAQQGLRLVVCGTDTDVGKTRLLDLPPDRLLPEAYRLSEPLSPHWAAERDGVTIDRERLTLPAVEGPLVVETAGGLLVPLRRDWLQIEQLVVWGLPVLLVARSGLGTLNHTLLSLEALRRRGLEVLGLVLNGPRHADNPRTLEQLGGVPVLCELPPLDPLDAAALQAQWQASALARTLQP